MYVARIKLIIKPAYKLCWYCSKMPFAGWSIGGYNLTVVHACLFFCFVLFLTLFMSSKPSMVRQYKGQRSCRAGSQYCTSENKNARHFRTHLKPKIWSVVYTTVPSAFGWLQWPSCDVTDIRTGGLYRGHVSLQFFKTAFLTVEAAFFFSQICPLAKGMLWNDVYLRLPFPYASGPETTCRPQLKFVF